MNRVGRISEKIVLIVDDDPDHRSLFQILFKSHGFKVLVAEDAKAALVLLDQNENTNLVVTDLQMPEMSGLELSFEIRKRNFQCPIVLVTGCGLDLSKDQLSAAGIEAVFKKPIVILKLLEDAKSLVAASNL